MGKSDVAEGYSPPRLTAMAKQMGMQAGWAYDLTTIDEDDGQPWDFSKADKQAKAKKRVVEDKPFMLP